jgi:RNA polymerase sigma-70 factor (ECF subfamily)
VGNPDRPITAIISLANTDQNHGARSASAGDLVQRASRGDRDAFGQLAARHLEASFRTALAIIGNEADARDVVQDVFLTAWRELPRIRQLDHFEAWLGRVLVNACRSHLRVRRRISVRELSVDSFAADAEFAKPAAAARPFDERTAALDTIERAFNRLSGADRALLVLHHGDRRQLSEIAFTLGIPVGTVKSRLHAARQSLERAMEVETR